MHMVHTIHIRYNFVYHTHTGGMAMHIRIWYVYYVKIVSRIKVLLALTATVSLSPGLAPFCLHARANLFDLVICN